MRKFAYINATTIEEASSALNEYGGNAKVIAGGTDLLYILKDNVLPSYPQAIVNLNTIPGLEYIMEEGGILKIGALTRIHDIDKNTTVRTKYSALAEAAHLVASPIIRRMGTIGGNLCQDNWCWYYRVENNRFYCIRKGGLGCPAAAEKAANQYNAILGWAVCPAACPSDTAIALAALNATIVTNKGNIPVLDLTDEMGTLLGDDGIVTEVQVPEPQSGTKQAFLRVAPRKSIDFAIASVATAITVEAGNVSDARIVLGGGVAPTPYRATAAEDALKGNAISESVAEAAAAAAVEDAVPLSKNAYIVQIAKTLVKRAILA
jgi:xanthine dehydrogenase YagS FAD-binding subunit